MSESFQILRGSPIRLSSRRVCSSALTSSQYLNRRMPDWTIAFSNGGTSSRKRSVCSGVLNPITFSTPARLYQLRSKMVTSPAAGKCGTNRWMYICDFSRSVGVCSATTRNTRGLTRSVIRLMVPPFPAVSRPSNTTQTFAPLALTHSCRATSSPCSSRICFSYSLVFILAVALVSPPGASDAGAVVLLAFFDFLLIGPVPLARRRGDAGASATMLVDCPTWRGRSLVPGKDRESTSAVLVLRGSCRLHRGRAKVVACQDQSCCESSRHRCVARPGH